MSMCINIIIIQQNKKKLKNTSDNC